MYLNWLLLSMAHTKMSDYCTNVINITQHWSLIYIHMNSLLDLGNIYLLTLTCHTDCAFYCFPPGPRHITRHVAFCLYLKGWADPFLRMWKSRLTLVLDWTTHLVCLIHRTNTNRPPNRLQLGDCQTSSNRAVVVLLTNSLVWFIFNWKKPVYVGT